MREWILVKDADVKFDGALWTYWQDGVWFDVVVWAGQVVALDTRKDPEKKWKPE